MISIFFLVFLILSDLSILRLEVMANHCLEGETRPFDCSTLNVIQPTSYLLRLDTILEVVILYDEILTVS